MRQCDCLNDCGDDPDLKHGIAEPCKRLQLVRRAKPPRVDRITRGGDDNNIVIRFVRPISDIQIETIQQAINMEAERYIP